MRLPNLPQVREYEVKTMVKIPNRLEDLLPVTAIEKFLDAMQQPDLSGRVKDALERVGSLAGSANPLEQVQQAWQQARSWVESLSGGSHNTQPQLINATGQLLSEEFSGFALSSSVSQSYSAAATHFLHAQSIAERIERTSSNAFAGKAVCWQDSVFSAVQNLLRGKTVLLPRTNSLRIPGLGDVQAGLLAGLAIVEVGPTNGCEEADWKTALEKLSIEEKQQSVVLIVSPNGLGQAQSTTQEELAIRVAREHQVPVVALRADATMSDQLNERLGFPLLQNEAADMVVAPLNLMLGAPRGAVILANPENSASDANESGADWIQRCHRRAIENQTCLSGPELLAANLAIQLNWLHNEHSDEEEAEHLSGALYCLSANLDNLKSRAIRLATQLDNQGPIEAAEACERNGSLGPSPWHEYRLPSWAVELKPRESAEQLCEHLMAGTEDGGELVVKPIAAREEEGRVVLDLRFVEPAQDYQLVMALSDPSEAASSS